MGARKPKGLNRIAKIKGPKQEKAKSGSKKTKEPKQDSQNMGASKPKGLKRIVKIWELEKQRA